MGIIKKTYNQLGDFGDFGCLNGFGNNPLLLIFDPGNHGLVDLHIHFGTHIGVLNIV